MFAGALKNSTTSVHMFIDDRQISKEVIAFIQESNAVTFGQFVHRCELILAVEFQTIYLDKPDITKTEYRRARQFHLFISYKTFKISMMQ